MYKDTSPPYLVTYTDKHVSHTLNTQHDVDTFFLKLGWEVSQTQPLHIFKDPINETLAISLPLPKAMWPAKKRAPMKPLSFNTELIWGLVSWSLAHNPFLNFGTEDEPLFKLTEIYTTLPDTLIPHLPPVRRVVNLMKINGEMKLTTVRLNKYEVLSVWKPTNPPKHVILSPKAYLRNLSYELIQKEHEHAN